MTEGGWLVDPLSTPPAHISQQPSRHTPILKTALNNSSLSSVPTHLRPIVDPVLARLKEALLPQLLPVPEIAVTRHEQLQYLDHDLPCLDLESSGLTNEDEVVLERRLDCCPKSRAAAGLAEVLLSLGFIVDRKSTRLNSSHEFVSRMPSSA